MPEHQGCWSAQVRTVVPEARRALEEGCAVVIGLQSTGEAAADSLGLEPGQVLRLRVDHQADAAPLRGHAFSFEAGDAEEW